MDEGRRYTVIHCTIVYCCVLSHSKVMFFFRMRSSVAMAVHCSGTVIDQVSAPREGGCERLRYHGRAMQWWSLVGILGPTTVGQQRCGAEGGIVQRDPSGTVIRGCKSHELLRIARLTSQVVVGWSRVRTVTGLATYDETDNSP
jgi:hypothetical protein